MVVKVLKNLSLNKRNPVARTLKTFTQKIVPDKKKYDRKKTQKTHFPSRQR